MSASSHRQRDEDSLSTATAESELVHDRPAAIAAARVSRATLTVGGLGLVSAVFVIARLFETWRLGSRGASDQLSILGARLSHPTANLDAIVIMLLAALGSIVIVLALAGVGRELRASRRFHRFLARERPQTLLGAWLIEDARPRAFCAGLWRPRVYVTAGALAVLDHAALDAVLAHERHHARRHDPLRHAVGRVLSRALFFLPGLGDLFEQHQALAELSADESAVDGAPANRSALARAMLSFSDASAPAGATGIDPSRVDYLLGDAPSWRFPIVSCLVAASVIALLIAVAVLAGRLATGSATLALPFLSRQPCIVVLAGLAAGVALLGAIYHRRRRRDAASVWDKMRAAGLEVDVESRR